MITKKRQDEGNQWCLFPTWRLDHYAGQVINPGQSCPFSSKMSLNIDLDLGSVGADKYSPR